MDKNKKFAVAVMTILIILCLSACNKSSFDAKNTKSEDEISLDMEKREIDELLGTPEMTYIDTYSYKDDLEIEYKDGKAFKLSIGGERWKTDKNISVGDSIDDVIKAYGDEDLVDYSLADNLSDLAKNLLKNEYGLIYQLDGKGKQCGILDAERVVTFRIDKETKEVFKITISKY